MSVDPSSPRPRPLIDIWFVSTPMDPRGGVCRASAGFAWCMLSPGDHHRARRLPTAVRQAWVCARGAVRGLLAEYVDIPAAMLPIVTGSTGKPTLDLPAAPHFNVSHDGPVTVLAVSRDSPVGVDIAIPGDRLAVEALAARYFAKSDIAELAASGARARDVFARLWARKEACAKAGAGSVTDTLSVPVAGRSPQVLRTVVGGREGTWHVQDLPTPDGCAAVAVPGQLAAEIRLRRAPVPIASAEGNLAEVREPVPVQW